MKQIAEQKLIAHFKSRPQFSREELFNYFLHNEGELNENTFGWRIYDLKHKNILQDVKRDWYTLYSKPVYQPVVNNKIEKLVTLFTKNYRSVDYCAWNIHWLNEFTIHQFSKELILFETEKEVEESTANTFSDNRYNVIRVLKGYLTSRQTLTILIVVFPLVSRAPLQKIEIGKGKEISVPTLEKILVDIYNEEKIFGFLQGAEMKRIFENAMNRYSINYTTLFGYAKRRGKYEELREYMNKHFPENM